MRALFSASPGLGHNYPLVPTAWALRAAGHEVVWATYGASQQVAAAGLSVVDAAPDTAPAERFMGFFERHPELAGNEERLYGNVDRALTGLLFAEVSEPALQATVQLAQRWRPDVVLHSPLDGAGPLAAAAAGVPAVCHAFSPGSGDPELGRAVATNLTADYERYEARPAPRAACIDLVPPRLVADPVPGWQFGYRPYNGGAVLPDWLAEPATRPRVAVTLGSVVPQVGGVGALHGLVAAAGEVDAEFVLALGGAEHWALGPLPGNVRPVPWIPLSDLLPTCAAAVHHGGAGTTFTALRAAVPQLVLPHGADQFVNATLVSELGAGTIAKPADVSADRLRALLGDAGLRAGASAFAAELAALPAVTAVPAALESLLSARA